MRKYENEVKVRVLIDFEPELENYEMVQIKAGTILTLLHSNKYRDDYEFKGYREVGYQPPFIEDPTHFELAHIDNWKKELEGD